MKKEVRPILLTTLSHMALHISELSFPALSFLIIRELLGADKAYDKVGFAFFIFSLFFGLMQLLGGILSDRLGARKTIWIYLFGSGLSMILVGFSPNYLFLVLSLALVGIFLGIYHPAGTALLSRATQRHGESMGIHGMGGNLGLALSPFLASGLASVLGWRKGFMGLGLIPLALSFWPLLDSRLEYKKEHEIESADNDSSGNNSFLLLPVIVLLTISFFNGLCYRGFTTFLPSYFNEKLSQNLVPGFSHLFQTGIFTTTVLVLGIVGQFLGGRLADRYSREKLLGAVFLAGVPFLFSLSFLNEGWLILSAMSFAFFYFANQPVSNALVPQYSSPRVIGRLYGWFYFMSFGAGSIMSWVSGMIGQKIALKYIFIVISFLLLITGLLCFLLLPFQKSKHRK